MKGVSKGAALSRFFFHQANEGAEADQYTFCLCVGHERSDEDMFKSCTEYFTTLQDAEKQTFKAAMMGQMDVEQQDFAPPQRSRSPQHGQSASKDTGIASNKPVQVVSLFYKYFDFILC